MEQFLTFGIVGLSTAAIYAVIGSGLVLTYVTTGVFNFAHGAAGMLAAFCYWQLTVGWGVPVPIALAVVLLVLAPAFGLFVERVLLRPVQHLGEAEKLVMTVALLTGLIAGARWIWDPNEPRPMPTFFADAEPLRWGPVTVTWHQAITMLVAIVVAAGLRILLFRTRVGAEMRATVDDRALAGLTGADPLRAGRVAWILGTQLAAVGGILIAPTVAMDAAALSLLIVSAYTAAIFGRLRSLPMTFLGAVVVGCLEAYLAGYLPQNDYLPGLRLAAPALLLFLALLMFPHRRLRGRDRRLVPVPLPTWKGTAVFAGAVVLTGVFFATTMGAEELITYGPVFSLGVIALSYVPLAGYAGQISLCQLGMAGIGALVWGHMAEGGELWVLAVAVVVSAAAGALIALPALRLSGMYLALGTTAFTFVMDRWLFTLPDLHLGPVTLKFFKEGSVEAAGPSLLGLRLDDGRELMVFAAVCLALVSVLVAAVRRGRFGRRLIALRDSEAAYATLGGRLLAAKVGVFALSAGIAGLGGALYGMQLGTITAENFNFVAGLPLFLVAVIGGLGSVGTGLFTGVAFVAPMHGLTALVPAAHNLGAILPALAGLGLARSPDGVVPHFRHDWTPVGRDRTVLSGLLVTLGLTWGLKVTGVVNGWTFAAVLFILVLLVRPVTAARAARRAGPAGRDVPIEWWGVRRPWRPSDGEVLARGIAAG